ncbi:MULTISPECIES: MATE family efflux transporter [unclassified Streptomyces]|uniref:MATE family efflux transporter n=1 Tax=unclassified Streptomyces TaxID=2593676 RepID=UPI002366966B|nr:MULTISPECIES: MATE family efflux transporter [unclassified Streptomyces]MDF3142182.1 MATE family efflux transporter [Streptomyces sp. T21Q-yed]WDF42206.1 MATE family efflux transporter [Streptomyces sp. T12]
MTIEPVINNGTARAGHSTWTAIAGAALPLYLTMIAASAGALVDTALLGNHSTATLAAFAVTLAVFSPATATVAGALRGVMPFVTPRKEDPDRLLAVVHSAMWLAITVGAIAAAAVASVPVIGRATGVPRTALDQLGIFPFLLAGSVLAIAVGQSATSVLVALGHSRPVMRAGLLGTAASAALSVLLVGGPGPLPSYGLTGAGIAILASSVISACVNQVTLRRSTPPTSRSLYPGRPDVKQVRKLGAVGIPLAGTVLVKFAVLGVLTFAAARIGTDSAAVHSVGISLVNLIFTAAVAVGQATIPLVSEYAEKYDSASIRRCVRTGTWLALAAVGLIATAVIVLSPWVVAPFTKDAVVRPQITELLPLVLAVVVTDALQAVVGFGLIGLKRTVPSFVSTLICYGALAAVAAPVAAAGGLAALWTALALANFLQAVSKAYSFHRHSTFPAQRW